MSETLLTLETGRFNGSMHQPGVGTSYLEFDVVKGLQLPHTAPLEFVHYSLPNVGNDIQQLSLPEDTAKKIYDFSETTYVHGTGDFDCRAFLGYVMGWDTKITTGVPRACRGDYVGPADTKNNLPYFISQEDGGMSPHAVLGIEQPGKSLSVAGFEYSLIIADNADLLRVFGGFALIEVMKIEDL
jgi:hypothetical protein